MITGYKVTWTEHENDYNDDDDIYYLHNEVYYTTRHTKATEYFNNLRTQYKKERETADWKESFVRWSNCADQFYMEYLTDTGVWWVVELNIEEIKIDDEEGNKNDPVI